MAVLPAGHQPQRWIRYDPVAARLRASEQTNDSREKLYTYTHFRSIYKVFTHFFVVFSRFHRVYTPETRYKKKN